ncbi:MAG: hypothetical protein K6F75_11505 [Butyrivibrio sp.]|nr:hypothetical protein [Butyrivibrio sp.]
MSKNNGFGKFILFCITVGAAAAGVYYYLTKRDAAIADEFDEDDFDDFEDFEDEEEDTPEIKFGSRKYVDIKTSESEESDSKKDEELDEADKASEEPAASKSEEFFDDEK